MYYQADTIRKAILSVILQCLIAYIYCKCFHCLIFFWIYRRIGLVGWNRSGCSESVLLIYGIFDLKYSIVAYFVLISLSLRLICFSYLSIRRRYCNRNPCFRHRKPSKSQVVALIVNQIFCMFHLINFLINPIIKYSLRMPPFCKNL